MDEKRFEIRRRQSTPPRLAERLLKSCLPPREREPILGDLLERQARQPAGKRGWYWKRALSIGLRFAAERLRERLQAFGQRNRGGIMEGLGQDCRLAVRALGNHPGFSAAAVLCIALSVGAVTSVFSVVDGVLLRPLDYPDPHELVSVRELDLRKGGMGNLSGPNFLDFREGVRSMKAMGAYRSWSVTLSGEGAPEVVGCAAVTDRVFETLGIEPALGRDFVDEEFRTGGPDAVILSHAWWQSRFAADPSILGKSLNLDGTPSRVVGIMPEGFRIPGRSGDGLWIPHNLDFTPEHRGAKYLRTIGRLRPGASLETVNKDLADVAARVAESFPETNSNVGARVVSLHERMVGSVKTKLLLLQGAVAFLLLLSCANVANMYLARSSARRGEMSLRAILGAGRYRLVRQVGLESLVLAGIGGGLGVLLGSWSTQGLLGLASRSIPRVEEVTLDYRVLAFAFVVTLITALLFGTVPALYSLRVRLVDGVRQVERQARSGRQTLRVRRGLAAFQVAIALVLLVGAGLLIHSFTLLLRTDLGFNPGGVLQASISLGDDRKDYRSQIRFFSRLLERTRDRPEVERAALGIYSPLSGNKLLSSLELPGQTTDPDRGNPIARLLPVSSGFFETLQIKLLAGRSIEDRDREESPSVAVINRTAAQRFWPDQDPLGQVLKVGLEFGKQPDPFRERRIVGIVDDVRFGGVDTPALPQVFLPYRQYPTRFMSLLARTRGEPGDLAPLFRHQLKELDPRVAASRVTTLEEMFDTSLREDRFYATLLGLFAGLGLVLSSIGIYGVLMFNVTQRRGEMGVRLALGATPASLIRLVVGEGALVALLGVALGLAASIALTRILTGFLYELSPTDPLTFGLTALILGCVALIASYLPARQAGRVDPIVTLRDV